MAFDTTHLLENGAATGGAFNFVNRAGNASTLQGEGTQGEWCTGVDSSPSATPPLTNPPGRTAYVYTEASGGSVGGDLWTMTRNTSFNASTQNVKLDYIYMDSVDVTSSILVQYATVANPNQTTDWTTIATHQGTGSAADNWANGTVDFSAQTTTTLHYRIKGNLTGTSNGSWRNDAAFSTFREYATDKAVAGKGAFLGIAQKAVSMPTENPGPFSVTLAEEWGSVAVLFRSIPVIVPGTKELKNTAKYKTIESTGKVTVADGVSIDNIGFNSNLVLEGVQDVTGISVTGTVTFEADGTYAFNDSIINEVINTSGDNVIINSNNSTFATNTGPDITINNSVPITLTVIDEAGQPVEDARVRLTNLANGTVVIEGLTDATGKLSDVFNYALDVAVGGWVRKNSFTPFYKQGNITGSISSSGFSATVQLVSDE